MLHACECVGYGGGPTNPLPTPVLVKPPTTALLTVVKSTVNEKKNTLVKSAFFPSTLVHNFAPPLPPPIMSFVSNRKKKGQKLISFLARRPSFSWGTGATRCVQNLLLIHKINDKIKQYYLLFLNKIINIYV